MQEPATLPNIIQSHIVRVDFGIATVRTSISGKRSSMSFVKNYSQLAVDYPSAAGQPVGS